jgi:hypothetical protein
MEALVSGSFVPGLELAHGLFVQHIEPILAAAYPQLRYSAGLIGSGSEVLGFDTPMSADHHWGPRAMLFLEPADVLRLGAEIRALLAQQLPPTYRGYSTHFSAPDALDHGVQRLEAHAGGPINHRVEIDSIAGYVSGYLGMQVAEPITAADWLTFPSQKLRAVGAGGVFRDQLGLRALRERLAWYPHDVWMYLLGCLWTRIGQEEHLVGRSADVGDELGSAILASRLVRDLMRIVFCLQRQYPPYPKWFGHAFVQLPGARELLPEFNAAQQAQSFQQREAALCGAYEAVVEMQRAVGIPIGGDGRTGAFWGRPFRVIHADKIAAAVFATIADAQLATLARTRAIGSIDLLSDNTDLLEDPRLRPQLRALYEG